MQLLEMPLINNQALYNYGNPDLRPKRMNL